jgi:hypothetical protein
VWITYETKPQSVNELPFLVRESRRAPAFAAVIGCASCCVVALARDRSYVRPLLPVDAVYNIAKKLTHKRF